MAEYATGKTTGMAIGGLATGIIGTLNALAGGNGLGILNGGGNSVTANDMASVVAAVTSAANLAQKHPEDEYVTRHEMNMVQEINNKNNEIALLKSEQVAENKMTEVYRLLKTDMNAFEKEQSAWNAQQMVNNATMSANIATNANSIAALQNCCNNITKLVIPAENICPKPMPLYNSWKDPTA